jgi:Niemann-Pick C1 protein
MINIGGFMHQLGLTLDFVTCIGLQLSVGLCVDYASHIGHSFFTNSKGTRKERAHKALINIGPAVCYGGMSTLLAFSAFASIDAYAYLAIFKVNFFSNFFFFQVSLDYLSFL